MSTAVIPRPRLGPVAGLAILLTLVLGAFTPGPAAAAPSGLPGMDVSSHQGNVAWSTAWANGARFAYVKATEGTSYKNPYFAQQYNGSYNVGMIRGAYHFALPNNSSGTAQADYFASNGGGWSKDGKTLPGALDIEYNPYGATCYGLSQSSMRSWISAFLNEYHTRTGRWAVIYTTTDWWTTCTGNYSGFAANSPLWIARYSSSVGTLPAGWSVYSFWQWSSSGVFPGDQDVWNGTLDRLKVLACNGTC
jgi:GH25 family lysozyme M1 (1,4-beta-N-acetylmuramidase)